MSDTDLQGDTYKCDAGYFCTIGASTKTPTLGNEGGGVCSAGHYCPQATISPEPCPPGSYNPTTGGQSIDDCVACDAKYYCDGWGTVSPQVCEQGWYCEQYQNATWNNNAGKQLGSSSRAPYDFLNNAPQICPAGHQCTGGEKIACSGKFQD
jgi:hypothetical protein